MISSLRRAALGAGLVLAAALAGCSSSSNGGSSPPAGTSPAPGGTTSAPGGTTASAGGAPNAATTQAIKKAYAVFFNSRAKTSEAVASLQHGAKFRSAIIAEGKSNYGKQQTTASVSSVKLQNPNVANVMFSVKVGGQTMLPNSPGFAVREGGKWKVAAQTFCNLQKLQGSAPKLCNNASITALPS